jgi:hypothetical protein
MFAIPIPMALPLASCQPGPIHSTPDGRVWFGRADRVNPDTQMFEEASFTLTNAPRQGDELWIDANAITIPLAQPLPAPQPTDWPALDDLERAIAEARAALAGAPRFHAAAAKAKAEAACWRAQGAIEAARLAVAEAVAAAAREQQEKDQQGEEWLAAMDAAIYQSDLSDLDHNDHPALTPSQRNISLQ